MKSDSDPVNHPSHYNLGCIEVIDAIEAWDLGFHLGNVVKYIARAEHKGKRLEDLRKAQWYLKREACRRGGHIYRYSAPSNASISVDAACAAWGLTPRLHDVIDESVYDGGNLGRALAALEDEIEEESKLASTRTGDVRDDSRDGGGWQFVNDHRYIAGNLWELLNAVRPWFRGDWWGDLCNWCQKNAGRDVNEAVPPHCLFADNEERDLAILMRDAARDASARDLEARREAQAEARRLREELASYRSAEIGGVK